MLELIPNVLLGKSDQEQLWSVRCDLSEILELLMDPPTWAAKINGSEHGLPSDFQITLADRAKHPDITIFFIFPFGTSQKASDPASYVVEGVGCTNLLTVRAPHALGERARSFLEGILPFEGMEATAVGEVLARSSGQLNLAIRTRDNLAYYHYELSQSQKNYELQSQEDRQTVLRNAMIAITHPDAFLHALNSKADARTGIMASAQIGEEPAENGVMNVYQIDETNAWARSAVPVRFDTLLPSAASTAEMGAAPEATSAIERLRFIYQWHDGEKFDCACCKAAAIAVQSGDGGFEIRTDLISFVCYACP